MTGPDSSAGASGDWVRESRMDRRFNVAGTCIPEKHFMADTSDKIDRIVRLIEQDSYFVMNRAR